MTRPSRGASPRRRLDGADAAQPASERASVRAAVWSLSDQALISGSSLVAMLLLARALQPSAFGAFVLAYTALLMANNLQTALVTQPHNVLGAARPEADYRAYTGSTAFTQALLGVGLVMSAGIAAVVLALTGTSGSALFAALAVALATTQAAEFVRRVLYTEGRVGAALGLDLATYGGYSVLLTLLWILDELSAPVALFAFAATAGLAAALGLPLIASRVAWSVRAADMRANWEFGKWLAAARAAFWLSSHLYIYVAAIVVGPTASAVLKAGQLLLAPLNVLLLALDTLLPIRFARILADAGREGLTRSVRRVYRLTAVPVLGYCIFVGVLAEPLLDIVYDGKYTGYALVVVLFATLYACSYVAQIPISALSAQRQTRAVFAGNLTAAAVGVGSSWVLVSVFETEGAALGMVVSIVALNAVVWRAYRRRDHVPDPSRLPTEAAPGEAILGRSPVP